MSLYSFGPAQPSSNMCWAKHDETSQVSWSRQQPSHGQQLTQSYQQAPENNKQHTSAIPLLPSHFRQQPSRANQQATDKEQQISDISNLAPSGFSSFIFLPASPHCFPLLFFQSNSPPENQSPPLNPLQKSPKINTQLLPETCDTGEFPQSYPMSHHRSFP